MAARFITFEGLDGSGKSTQLALASAWLRERGVAHLATREPGGTPLADALRGLFLDPKFGAIDGTVELLLVFASRRDHLLAVIEPALARGEPVLCDRFTDSTFAYQGSGRGVPRERIEAIDAWSTGGRRPDLSLLFDLPAEAARGRGANPAREQGTDRLDAESLAFYSRVREGFLEQAARDPARFRLLDATAPLEENRDRVRAILAEALEFDRAEVGR